MDFKKVLIIKTRAMGDTVISTAAANSLREALSEDCEIHMLVSSPWHVLLKEHNSVDRVYSMSKSDRLKTRIKLIFDLRKEKYDAVFALHASSTTALISLLTGASHRANHFHGIEDKNSFSTQKIAGKGKIKPILLRDLDTLKALVPAAKLTNTSLHLSDDELAAAKELLGDRQGPYLILAPGASRPAKIWPLSRFAQLAQRWQQEKNGTVIVMLGPNERDMADVFSENKNTLVRCGGDLRLNAAIMSRAQLFIGNDSGPKHIAVALGIPTRTIFGPESPLEWHPYNQDHHQVLFKNGLDCRQPLAEGLPEWCSVHSCKKFQHRCMKDITVDEVVEGW